MQLGFVSAILPELSLEEVAAFASEAGFACVELMCWPKGGAERRYAGVTHVDVSDFSVEDAANVKAIMDAAGVAISGLGYYPNPLDPNEQASEVYVAHIKKVIRASSMLGVGVMNTFIGRDWTRSIDDNWTRFQEIWPGVIQYAEEWDVRVGIENCPMYFTADEWPGGKNLATTPAIWRRMFAEIPSDHFGLNYDPSHMVWQQMDYIKPLREFSHKLVHVHAKDVRMDREKLDDVGIMAHPLEYHTPKLPGLGEVDWGMFISVLGDAGYNGPVCIEVEDRVYEGSLAARKASLIQSGTYLRQFIADY